MRGTPVFAGFQSFQNYLGLSGSGHQLNPWHSDYSIHSCKQRLLSSFRCNLDGPAGKQKMRDGGHKVFYVDSSEPRPPSANNALLQPGRVQHSFAGLVLFSLEVFTGLGAETGSDSE